MKIKIIKNHPYISRLSSVGLLIFEFERSVDCMDYYLGNNLKEQIDNVFKKWSSIKNLNIRGHANPNRINLVRDLISNCVEWASFYEILRTEYLIVADLNIKTILSKFESRKSSQYLINELYVDYFRLLKNSSLPSSLIPRKFDVFNINSETCDSIEFLPFEYKVNTDQFLSCLETLLIKTTTTDILISYLESNQYDYQRYKENILPVIKFIIYLMLEKSWNVR